jgi:hypothetical protein
LPSLALSLVSGCWVGDGGAEAAVATVLFLAVFLLGYFLRLRRPSSPTSGGGGGGDVRGRAACGQEQGVRLGATEGVPAAVDSARSGRSGPADSAGVGGGAGVGQAETTGEGSGGSEDCAAQAAAAAAAVFELPEFGVWRMWFFKVAPPLAPRRLPHIPPPTSLFNDTVVGF